MKNSNLRPYLLYIALHIILLLSTINMSAISVAFPDITSTFNVSLVLAGWVISIYQMVGIPASLVVGKISYIIGRKQTLLFCVALFILGSLLSAISSNIYWLIFFRFVQSLGAGGLMAVTIGILAVLFPNSRQKAIGISAGIMNIGGIIGPNVGAWLLSSWGWRSIFWFNVPVGILACIPVIILMRANQGQNSRIDFRGAGLITGAVFSIMISLSMIGLNNTFSNWLILGLLFGTGVVFIILFIRHEVSAKDPILDLEFLRRKEFVAFNLYNFVFGFSNSYFSFLPLYVITVYSYTAFQSSLVLTFRALGVILSAMISSVYIVKWGYRLPLLIGTVLFAGAVLVMGFEPQGFTIWGFNLTSLFILAGLGMLSGIGLGVVAPGSNNAVIDLAPERAASITGVRGMFGWSGSAIFITITTLLLQHISDRALGFRIVFFTLSAVVLASIPCIFILPRRAKSPEQEKVKGEV